MSHIPLRAIYICLGGRIRCLRVVRKCDLVLHVCQGYVTPKYATKLSRYSSPTSHQLAIANGHSANTQCTALYTPLPLYPHHHGCPLFSSPFNYIYTPFRMYPLHIVLIKDQIAISQTRTFVYDVVAYNILNKNNSRLLLHSYNISNLSK